MSRKSYPSDLTDEQWGSSAPYSHQPNPEAGPVQWTCGR